MIEYRNMKKGLIAAGLLVSLSGTAQDVSTYTPGTMGEGVVYYLPKTEIESVSYTHLPMYLLVFYPHQSHRWNIRNE